MRKTKANISAGHKEHAREEKRNAKGKMQQLA
jgi:hypothetical protein